MMEPDQEQAIAKIQLLRGEVAISVNLSWCILDDAALECLKGLPQLRELYLSHTDVSDAGLEHLKGLRQLRELHVHSTGVTGAGLEHLKGLGQLQKLDLGGTKVTDAGLEHLKDLPQLQELNFSDTRVTEAGLKQLRWLTQLRELNLSGTEVTEAGLEHLKGLRQLQTLDLRDAPVTDAGLKHLRGLPQVRELDLGGTKVTDAGLEHLTGLRQLERLDLCDTGITDAGLEHLKGLRQLQELGLSGTEVTDAGLEHLKGLRHEIKERRQAEELLLKDQRYLRYLLELQDRDRQMVSYEIHDGLVPQLAAAIMQLEAFSRLTGRGDNEAWKSFETGLQRLNDCMREARQLISGLRSPILDESGVVAAVEDLISQDSARDKPKIEFVHHLDYARLAPSLENAIYRIVQESLTNARRYSQSERVLVRLTQRGRYIRIEVRDWGIGFNPREVGEGHFGLEGIRKRARLFGGSATIKSTLGKGTRIVVQLPLVGGVGRGPEKELVPS